MLSLILYSFVIVNQIECIENRGETTSFSPEVTTNQTTFRKKHKQETTPTSIEFEAKKYSLTNTFIEINQTKQPNDDDDDDDQPNSKSQEYNYIIVVPKPSFLRIKCSTPWMQGNNIQRGVQKKIKNEDILFIMKTNNSVKSWKINNMKKYEHDYEATISKTAADDEEIRITVHSQYFQHTEFTMNISLLDDTDVMLELGKSIDTTISKSTSRLFQFVFPNTNDDMVLLKIEEPSRTSHQCSLVSVQPIGSNQLYDEEDNMRFGNGTMYQTMSTLSAIILKRAQFPNGANIILLSVKDKSECFEEDTSNNKRKTRERRNIKLKNVSSAPLIFWSKFFFYERSQLALKRWSKTRSSQQLQFFLHTLEWA